MHALRIVAFMALGLSFVAAACSGAQEGPPSLEGKAAPDFTLPTLDEQSVKLSDLKGKVVVLDFWATWCPPCRKSLPHLNEMATNKDLAEKGLKVYAVNLREEKAKVEPFMKENKYEFVVPMDKDGSVAKLYLVRGIPTTVIVGRDGNVHKAFVGYGPGSGEAMDKAVEEALAVKSGEPTAP